MSNSDGAHLNANAETTLSNFIHFNLSLNTVVFVKT